MKEEEGVVPEKQQSHNNEEEDESESEPPEEKLVSEFDESELGEIEEKDEGTRTTELELGSIKYMQSEIVSNELRLVTESGLGAIKDMQSIEKTACSEETKESKLGGSESGLGEEGRVLIGGGHVSSLPIGKQCDEVVVKELEESKVVIIITECKKHEKETLLWKDKEEDSSTLIEEKVDELDEICIGKGDDGEEMVVKEQKELNTVEPSVENVQLDEKLEIIAEKDDEKEPHLCEDKAEENSQSKVVEEGDMVMKKELEESEKLGICSGKGDVGEEVIAKQEVDKVELDNLQPNEKLEFDVAEDNEDADVIAKKGKTLQSDFELEMSVEKGEELSTFEESSSGEKELHCMEREEADVFVVVKEEEVVALETNSDNLQTSENLEMSAEKQGVSDDEGKVGKGEINTFEELGSGGKVLGVVRNMEDVKEEPSFENLQPKDKLEISAKEYNEDTDVVSKEEKLATLDPNSENMHPDGNLGSSVVEDNDTVAKEGLDNIENSMSDDKFDAEIDNLQMGGRKTELAASKDDEDEDMAQNGEEETSTGGKEMEAAVRGGKKQKRGRNNGVSARASSRKKLGEEVCFICFDGGDLVLCDRRGCPKVYHPSCVNHDEAFFQAKGVWNCGWHLCSICEKDAYYKCYTCTFSLCKGCAKDAVFSCVRRNKGFCETCMKTVLLIEKNEHGNKEVQVDFDDKNNWEYLFKDYWLDLKGKLLLTQDELLQAKNPSKGSDVRAGKDESAEEIHDVNDDIGTGSDGSSGDLEAIAPKRRKVQKRLKSLDEEEHSPSAFESSGNLNGNKRKRRSTNKQSKSPSKEGDTPTAASAISAEGKRKKKKQSKSLIKEGDSLSAISAINAEEISTLVNTAWASKELLEFVMHLKNGDASILSQFDVQDLLLEYIKQNNLRDPRRKSHIKCDSRLENLFGKRRVGHFEMLKLLESHFLIRGDSQADDFQGSIVDNEVGQLDTDGNTDYPMKTGKNRNRRMLKKGDRRWLQSNIDDYAAIDVHNIKFVFLRRNLVEDLLEDTDYFHDKVFGCFVRIRISNSGQNQDMYRLVQVVGTSRADEPYRVGKRTTEIILEIQNLNKREVISIDIISNQEFTEDECRRLRQSIKCGLINPLTVGDIQEKAVALQALRVNDWLETEIVRLSHLSDRASDMGRRKELRECVEKIQLLKSPQERQRRLEEIPQVHTDPNMDPNHESEEDEDKIDDNKQENFWRSRDSGFSRQGRDSISPRIGGSITGDSWSGTKSYSSTNRELGRSFSSRGFLNKGEDSNLTGIIVNESIPSQGINPDTQLLHKIASVPDIVAQNIQTEVAPELSSGNVAKTSLAPLLPASSPSAAKINESEKIWHYKDPSGKVQGPFSIVQLRKWNTQGYFPKHLRIWRTSEKLDDAVLLSDILIGGSGKSADENTRSESQVSTSMAGDLSPKVPKALTVHGGNDKPMDLNSAPVQTTAGETEVQAASETRISAVSVPATGALASDSIHSVHSSAPSALTKPSGGTDGSYACHAILNQQISSAVNDAPSSLHGANVQTNPEVEKSSSRTLQYSSQSYASDNPHKAQSMPATQPELPADSSMNPSANCRDAAPNPPDMIHPVPIQQPAYHSEFQAPNNQCPAPMQQPVYGPGTPSFNPGVPSGPFPPQGFSGMPPSDAWRFPVPAQPMMQPPPPPSPHLAWGPMPGNPNMGWGGPVMNWGSSSQGPIPGNPDPAWFAPGQGPPPGNTNPGWAASGNPNPGWVQPCQVPTPGIPNQEWVAPGNAVPGWPQPGQVPATGNANPGWPAPNQGQAPGTINSGWVAPVQGPPGNTNPGWVPPIQGPATGNMNQGWGPPVGQPGTWGSEQNQNSSHTGSAPGGGRRWNGPAPFGRGVCNFHMNGHCKKGASCDYLHPPKQ